MTNTVFGERIREIFGEQMQDYSECANSRCISIMLQVPTNQRVDLPKRLDHLVELLNDRRIGAVFLPHGSNKLENGKFIFVDLEVEEGHADLRRGVASRVPMRITALERFDLFDHIDRATKLVGHRHVTARFASTGSSIFMLILASSEEAPDHDHEYKTNPNINYG